MTTVAWDGKTLASDTQASTGDVVCSLSEQKIYTITKQLTGLQAYVREQCLK